MCYALVAAAVACYGGLAHEIFNVVFTDAVSRRRYLFGLFLGPLIYGVSSLGPYSSLKPTKFRRLDLACSSRSAWSAEHSPKRHGGS